jgi:hypothetical protein
MEAPGSSPSSGTSRALLTSLEGLLDRGQPGPKVEELDLGRAVVTEDGWFAQRLNDEPGRLQGVEVGAQRPMRALVDMSRSPRSTAKLYRRSAA